MKVEYSKKFLNELAVIPSIDRVSVEEFVFETLTYLDNIFKSSKIESMKGYKDFYRIRFGNYKVGLLKEDDCIIISTVLHRKEIYKYFP